MEVLTEFDEPRVQRLLMADEYFWLDLTSPTDVDLRRIQKVFGLHPAAVEDSLEWRQLPKSDDYGNQLLVVFFSAGRQEGVQEPIEVHAHISGQWIITVRRCPTPLDDVHEELRQESTQDEDMIVYRILDALADAWDPVIDDLDERVDAVEVQVLARPRQDQLTTIYRLKQEIANLLRHATRQQAMFGGAIDAIHALPNFARGSREWLQDVASHLDSIMSNLRRLSGDLSALTDTFFNANANRLNRLVTYVTMGSIFFVVWTLVTGFFGQNFGYLVRHIDSRTAFFAYEGGALVLPTILIAAVLYWRRRDWL